jgi:hypothetical protein
MATIAVELPGNNSIRINKEGRIDSSAEHAFTRGQCHALALALHKLTGWKLYGLYDRNEWDNGETPGHVVVRSPKGKYIDITGDNALSNWQYYWPEAEPHCIREQDVLKLSTLDYCEPAIDAAYPYALTLSMLYAKQQLTLNDRS